MRIPETWESRGYQWPKDRPIEELMSPRQNAQYYAAFGAVVFGMSDAGADEGCATAASRARDYLTNGRKARLWAPRPAARW
jgi:hypothetical protein